MTLIKSLDCSNWQGTAVPDLIRQHQPSHVVIRASIETANLMVIARQQMNDVVFSGCLLDLYGWAYWHDDPVQSVRGWVDLGHASGQPFHNVWIDAEETARTLAGVKAKLPNGRQSLAVPKMGDRLKVLLTQHLAGKPLKVSPRKSTQSVVAWLEAAFGELDRLGVDGGVYSAAWWWIPYTGNSDALSQRKLWYANYDEVPNFSTWQHQAFGGWPAPSGKQYTSTPIDQNVFEDWAVSAGSPVVPPADPQDATAHLRFALNHVLNTNEQQLVERADALLAEADKLRTMADELARIRNQYAWVLVP